MAKPIYDPFSWNAPGNTLQDLYNWYLSGGDEVTDDTIIGGGGGGGGPAAGGEATNAMGVDLNRIRQPTGGSFDRTDIPNVTDTGEKFSSLPRTDPRYMSEAEQIFQQNRADAGAYAYDSPQYIGGARGNITQTGPGRQFIYDTTGDEYDDIHLYGGPEEDASWFKRLREGVNPLMQGVMTMAGPFMKGAQAIGQMFPVNERAIMEQQGLQQGFAMDNIGRVVAQDFGIKEDGTYGALNRDDPRNIFAGLNYHLIDQDTIDKMKARINKTIKKTTDKNKLKILKNRLDIIDQAWANKQLVDETTADLVDKKTREKGLTPMSDQIALNKAKLGMQQKIKDAENLVDEGIDASGLFGTEYEVPWVGDEFLYDPFQKHGTGHHYVTPDAPPKDYDTEGIEDEYDEFYREYPDYFLMDQVLKQNLKEKKEKEDLAKSIAVETGVTESTHPLISDAKRAAIDKAKAEESIDRDDTPGRDSGQPQTGGGGYERGDYGGRGYHWAKGGRVRYSKGGIVDLL